MLTKNEIIEILKLPHEEYTHTVMKEAKGLHESKNGGRLMATAMFGYDNICRNQCLYCGMRASNTAVKRYRILPDDVQTVSRAAREQGFKRIFFVSGEDPKYGFQNLLKIVSDAKSMGFHVSLACGEFSPEEYRQLRDAGTDQCVLKFEMSQPETFNRLNPSTSFSRRMKCIESVKNLGMELASGNIVDYPGQSLEMIADDILLMKELEISWAPIIPYMPAANTPLSLEGGRGSIELNLKEISILRLMMPDIYITAQQPGTDLKEGLAGDEGNLLAINGGADILFADMLPADMNFSVIDNRVTLGLEHIKHMAEISGSVLVF